MHSRRALENRETETLATDRPEKSALMPSQNNNGSPWGRGPMLSPTSRMCFEACANRLERVIPASALRYHHSHRPGSGRSRCMDGLLTVPSNSVAVVQRFGKFTQVTEPGLHFKIPFGVDTATIVPVRRQLKLEFGFATPGATNEDQTSASRTSKATWSPATSTPPWWSGWCSMASRRPRDFLYNVKNPGPTLRDLSESVMREVIGDRTVDEVLTFGRTEIENDALTRLQAMVEKINMGMRVEQVQLKTSTRRPRCSARSARSTRRSRKRSRRSTRRTANTTGSSRKPRAWPSNGSPRPRASRSSGQRGEGRRHPLRATAPPVRQGPGRDQTAALS